MLPLVLGIGAIIGLVSFAVTRGARPERVDKAERTRLEHLKLRRILSLDDAEDGLVLARRYGDGEAGKKFAAELSVLKSKRPKIV